MKIVTDDFFFPARKLYAKFGSTDAEPFGDYQASPHNTFMTKRLRPTSSGRQSSDTPWSN